MIMKFWLIVCLAVMQIVGAETSVSDGSKDNNKEAHRLLCNLMKAAANKWREVEKRASTDPLRKALKTTLFGYGTVETLETLKSGLPKDYKDLEKVPGSRGNCCGQPQFDDAWHYGDAQPRWPGQSAPHDLVCLCTVGSKGWPLNDTTKEATLCGRDKNALGGGDGKGWDDSGSGNEHVKATWENVTVPCLNGEAGGDLKQALNEFLGKLENSTVPHYTNTRQLGEGTPDIYGVCTGTPPRGVCVEYYLNMPPTPWWVELQKAIPEDEKLQKQREEEEKRIQQEKERKMDEPHAEIITSSETTTQGTEKNRTDTLHEKLRRLNITSGTPISGPSSWLLSAFLLI